MIDFRDRSNPDVRLFWFRRRLVVAGAVAAAAVLALYAYLPLGLTSGAEISERVFWYEWAMVIAAGIGAVGAILYALPWRFPGTEWSYLLLFWNAMVQFILFQISTPFTTGARAVVTSTLILVIVVAFCAHLLDGGQRKNENSLLFGPPP